MGLGTYTFGTGHFGTTVLGPPGPILCVESCVQTNTNAIEITFGPAQPQMIDPFGTNDALNRANYTIVPIVPPGATVRFVQWVVQIDDFTVKLWLDGPLDPAVIYEVQVSGNVIGIDCVPIDPGCTTCRVDTFFPVPTPDAIKEDDEKSLDLANPQLLSDAKQRDGTDAPLGTFQINQRGDLALESNPEYLRKRIIRRATTAMGEFFHLPGYGFGRPLKGKLAMSELRKIQGAAIRQIREEPDVRSVAVRVRQASPTNPNVVVLEIQVQDTSGRSDSFSVPIDYGAGEN